MNEDDERRLRHISATVLGGIVGFLLIQIAGALLIYRQNDEISEIRSILSALCRLLEPVTFC